MQIAIKYKSPIDIRLRCTTFFHIPQTFSLPGGIYPRKSLQLRSFYPDFRRNFKFCRHTACSGRQIQYHFQNHYHFFGNFTVKLCYVLFLDMFFGESILCANSPSFVIIRSPRYPCPICLPGISRALKLPQAKGLLRFSLFYRCLRIELRQVCSSLYKHICCTKRLSADGRMSSATASTLCCGCLIHSPFTHTAPSL